MSNNSLPTFELNMETAASERENANEEASGNAAVDMRNPQEGTRNPMEGGLTLAEIGIRDSSAVQDTVFGKVTELIFQLFLYFAYERNMTDMDKQ